MDASGPGIRPRSVLVIDDQSYLRMVQDAKAVRLLQDSNALIVPYSGDAELNEHAVNEVHAILAESGQLVPQALFVRRPYNAPGYELAENAVEAFSVAKYHAFGNLAGILGAKRVRVLETRLETAQSNWIAKIGARLPWATLNGEVTREVSKKLKQHLNAELRFEGGAPDREEALAFLQRTSLTNDAPMSSLVEMRSGKNLAKHYRFTLSGTQESASNFKIAMDLAVAASGFSGDVGAKFTRTVSAIRDIEITTEVTF